MSEFKGTKAAWRFSEEYMEITASRIGVLECSKSICVINKFPEFEYSGQTAKANALLISKAPEMLEMLKKCYEEFVKLAQKGQYPEGFLVCNGGNGLGEIEHLIKEATEL